MRAKKYNPEILSLLLKLSQEDLLFKDIARILSVKKATITRWLQRFFPDEFARRKELRGLWRTKYVPQLQKACDNSMTFDEIGALFGISYFTAYVWVLKYLGEEAFHSVPRKNMRYSSEDKERARCMRRAGAMLAEIVEELGMGIGTVSVCCRYIPRGSPSPEENFFSCVGERKEDGSDDGPTHEDLVAIEQGLEPNLI